VPESSPPGQPQEVLAGSDLGPMATALTTRYQSRSEESPSG
jgi:hypothetical protein